jgi:hypothetical protein
MNFLRSSTLLVPHAPKNDLVTATGSLSCACDAELHKATIAAIQMMPCLIAPLLIALAEAVHRAEFGIPL